MALQNQELSAVGSVCKVLLHACLVTVLPSSNSLLLRLLQSSAGHILLPRMPVRGELTQLPQGAWALLGYVPGFNLQEVGVGTGIR